MQGFNRYYPPDYDPKEHATLNAVHGKHALGVRARKIDQGILITRFELPFNIWCGGCNAHIGQGVRYNAEKRRVGSYFSTAIYAFRCKCHLCSHWFEIQTDPKNTRYVVTEGAREKYEQWDPAEAGQIVIEQKDPDAPVDPLAQVEKAVVDKANALSSASRLEYLHGLQEDRWTDPYALSKKLRTTFRADKKERKIRDEADDAMKSRMGLPMDLKLEDETTETKDQARELWIKEKSSSMGDQALNRRQRERIDIESVAIRIPSKTNLSLTKSKSSLSRKSLLNSRSKDTSQAKSLLVAKLLSGPIRSKGGF